MNKVVFAGTSFVALSVACSVSAQDNTSTITQTGSGNIADVSQPGSTNESVLSQDGTATGVDGIANEATITQEGANGYS